MADQFAKQIGFFPCRLVTTTIMIHMEVSIFLDGPGAVPNFPLKIAFLTNHHPTHKNKSFNISRRNQNAPSGPVEGPAWTPLAFFAGDGVTPL